MAATIGFASSTVRNFKIRLELTEPDKKDDSWSTTAIATVTTGTDIVTDAEVQFYHNGRAVDSPVDTDGEGRATKEFVDLKKGSHTFEAKIAGTSTSSRQTKVLKEEKPKKPAKIKISQAALGLGKYILNFQTLAEDGAPTQATIRILDRQLTNGVMELKTGSDGSVSHAFAVGIEKKILTITVLGSPIEPVTRTLYP